MRSLWKWMKIRKFLFLLFPLLMFSGCGQQERSNILTPDGSPSVSIMDFSNPISLKPLAEGWFHRTFWFVSPMDISFVTKDGYPSIRLATDNSASMLFRFVDFNLDQYPELSWNWMVEKGINSDISELTEEGDDQPARLFLSFEAPNGEKHRMEIIWGNREVKRGDWKYIKGSSFPHYVANGGDENIGRWFLENVDLVALYEHLWGSSAGVRLTDIGLFCDTDATGGQTVAYFSDIRANAKVGQ
ncbi:MAG TPA: DUF3047 domain-containing protein [Emcibacteraceae bacterium]|nr:DUF3047 domain-containing protein [Emcibacteraceae bacterium]